jgi:DNA-binding response OmpR family regulator
MPARILVVDDEVDLANMLRSGLKRAGYDVMVAYDGGEALRVTAELKPDLAILDIVMPGMDGLQLCKALRTRLGDGLPIIFLTARDQLTDVVVGLDLGADDYVTKPFAFPELEARIRGVLRRASYQRQQTEPSLRPLVVKDWTLDPRTFELNMGGKAVRLTPVETDLMVYFMHHHGQAFSARQLLCDVWGYKPGTGGTALVRVTIRNLRQKIERNAVQPKYLRTLRRRGYMLNVD